MEAQYQADLELEAEWLYDHRGEPICPIDQVGVPTSMGCEDPAPCGVNVIGGNTLGSTGVPAAGTGNIIVTAGDAAQFQPRAFYFEAHGFNNSGTINDAGLAGGQESFPVLLIDVFVGRVSMLRRGGEAERGLIQGGFSKKKPLVAVDWGDFVSTQEQNLTLQFYNPNANVALHVFCDIWGNI